MIKRILFLFLAFLLTASSLNDARKANEAFRNGNFEKAAELYRQAIEENPEDARLHYNLGTALAKLGESEQAVQAFEKAKQLTDDPEQQSMADYNAGTHLSEAEMYDEALDFFRNALRNNPDDPDIKHNYEMSVRKQQEQEQEQNQEQNEDNQENNEDDQQQNQDQQQDSQQDQQQDQNQQNQQQDQQDGEQDGNPSDQQQQPMPDEISKEEAENILNALEQLERSILENRKKEAEQSNASNEKDW